MKTKICATCGRTIEWRRKWERDWEHVRFCSTACRRHRPTQLDQALETKILELLDQRDQQATICPSEAARAVQRAPDGNWRALMQRTRSAARRLVAQGQLEIRQKGRKVDPSTAKGPIRLKLVTLNGKKVDDANAD